MQFGDEKIAQILFLDKQKPHRQAGKSFSKTKSILLDADLTIESMKS